MNKESHCKNLCQQFANNQITLKEFQKRYDELFNVMSGTEIVLNPRERIMMPPKQIIFKTSNTESYPKFFPIEMKNKHYLVDILDILRQGLLPFSDYIKTRCRRLQDPEGSDVHYILKWLKQNFDVWFPVVRNGQTEKTIKDLLYKLAELRNRLNHQNDTMDHDRLGRIPTVSTKNLDDCLKDSRGFLIQISSILGRDKIEFVLDNLDRFEQQWKAHHLWRKQRKVELRVEIQSNGGATEASPTQRGVIRSRGNPIIAVHQQIERHPQRSNSSANINQSSGRTQRPNTAPQSRQNPLTSAVVKTIRMEPGNLMSLNGSERMNFMKNLNLLCSSSPTFKITGNQLFFANENKILEIRNLNNIFTTVYTITDPRRVHCLRIRNSKLFVLNDNSIQIIHIPFMNNYYRSNREKKNYVDIEILIPGCNHLFAISPDNNSLFVMPRGGQEKYNIYWYSISNGTLLKTINIFAVDPVKVNFFRIIGNNPIIADNSFIYITEFDSNLNFKVNFKINRLIPNSTLMITKEKYFIEVVKDIQGTGRIDVWEISSGLNKISFAISSRPKIDGCFISDNHEFFSWYFLNNQLIIQSYNFINNNEKDILRYNLSPGNSVEDLFLNTSSKQIIARCKHQSGREIIHLNF